MQAGLETFRALLAASEDGRAAGVSRLFEACYAELHEIARGRMRREAFAQCQTTSLLHHTYLKLCDANLDRITDKQHFFAIASRAMWQVLADFARKRNVASGHREALGAACACRVATNISSQLGEVGTVFRFMEQLQREHPKEYEAISLIYLGELSHAEVARALGVARPTISHRARQGRRRLQEWMTSRTSN